MKPYPGAPEKYSVAPYGEVYSHSKKRRKGSGRLVGKIRKDGRREYLLFIDGQRVYKQAHHMVLETYVGPRPEGMDGCHNDGDPLNNYFGNLRWDTHTSNMNDKRAHGTHLEGESHGRARTTEEQVRKLRELRAAGITIAESARQVGIPYSRAWMIDKGHNWKECT